MPTKPGNARNPVSGQPADLFLELCQSLLQSLPVARILRRVHLL
ncbi:MAG: hypothetical protein QOF56_2596 [Acidobacteriaceae bacterium]|nr:hypothetical protein [Acidobacteriaceae bacterium]